MKQTIKPQESGTNFSNQFDVKYQKILQEIIDTGVEKTTRSGDVISKFDMSMRLNLNQGFPLLTTKQMYFKGIVHELLWFLKGDTNTKYLVENNVHIWDDDAYRHYKNVLEQMYKYAKEQFEKAVEENFIVGGNEPYKIEPFSKEEFLQKVKEGASLEFHYMLGNTLYDSYTYGDLGPIYGKQWTDWNGNQLKEIIQTLKTNPNDRRIILNGWNRDYLKEMALPPCHLMAVFYTTEMKLNERWTYFFKKFNLRKEYLLEMEDHDFEQSDEYILWREYARNQFSQTFSQQYLEQYYIPKYKLSCSFICRSQDYCLGTPYNISSYALLTHMIAQCANMDVDEIIWHGMDCHIYKNQIGEGLNEQLNRDPYRYDLPTLKLNPEITEIDKFTYNDIWVENYESYPPIKFPLSVG